MEEEKLVVIIKKLFETYKRPAVDIKFYADIEDEFLFYKNILKNILEK